MTKGQAAIREFTSTFTDTTGNLPPLPGIFLEYWAPIGRNGPEGRELVMARCVQPFSTLLPWPRSGRRLSGH